MPRRMGRPPIWHAVMAFGFGSVLLAADFPLVGHSALIPHPDWLRLLVLACLCALQLGRERAAVPMFLFGLPLVAVDAAMGLSLPAMIVAGDQLFTAILHGSRRASRILVWTVFVLMIAMAVAFLFIAADPRSWLLLVLQLGSLPLIPVWWAINMRQQRALTNAERERADSLAHIAVLDREAAVHAERASMARDLHDVIAGNMSAIAIQSEALLSMRDGDPDTVRAVLRSVRENAVERSPRCAPWSVFCARRTLPTASPRPRACVNSNGSSVRPRPPDWTCAPHRSRRTTCLLRSTCRRSGSCGKR